MIRRFGKTLYACAYSWSGAGVWASTTEEKTLPFIVAYHRVVENFERSARCAIPSLLTSTVMLERHLDYLSQQYELTSLDEIGRLLESGRPIRKPAAAITFDDGYADIYRFAYPILKRKGIPAALFVVTDLIGDTRVHAYDKLYFLVSQLQNPGNRLKDAVSRILASMGVECMGLGQLSAKEESPLHIATWLLTGLPQATIHAIINVLEGDSPIRQDVLDEMAPLSWAMIEEMQRNGFTIGSHTRTHALLSQESLDRTKAEVLESKDMLERRLNCEIKHFAYPDGRFNAQVVDAVRLAGYRYAYGICRVRDSRHPLLTIPRKVLWEKACVNAFGKFSPAMMNCHGNWAFDRNRGCRHNHGVNNRCPDQLAIV